MTNFPETNKLLPNDFNKTSNSSKKRRLLLKSSALAIASCMIIHKRTFANSFINSNQISKNTYLDIDQNDLLNDLRATILFGIGEIPEIGGFISLLIGFFWPESSKDVWDEITRKIGYWLDLENPYITFDNKYIESVWNLLQKLFDKGLLYKGYTIQPYSPAAGTGLSTHELNMPGCYRNVKDTTVVAKFKIVKNKKYDNLFNTNKDVYFLAWTTTPWTLPSNTALAVGKNIEYILVSSYNNYNEEIYYVIAKSLFNKYFTTWIELTSTALLKGISSVLNFVMINERYHEITNFSNLTKEEINAIQQSIKNDLKIHRPLGFEINSYTGSDLLEIRYEQLMPYALPEDGDPFRVVAGDFVSTEDGTGIVHIAPSFGADDFRMNRLFNVGALTLVDKQGRFTDKMGEFAGKFVKKEYDPNATDTSESVDVEIVVKLKKENKAFKTEKYEHSYPHCWRTDKPILYYPLDSWFVKTTAFKQRMTELNSTINWKPESTGTGRFGNWIENLVDWNLSRSRYWGIPLPVWSSEDGTERICIGSLEQLKIEIEKSVKAGFMTVDLLNKFIAGDFSNENYNQVDLHRPYVDQIILVSESGKKLVRELDLIDVWFDSGAMPYAQLHYPFENKEIFEKNFPADFIAEGVDQTRGWFFTLHAIATMLFDSVAFKNVISNGLVLDKDGNKMSKRLGNAVDPFETIAKYGPDAIRWYMITNSQPWDNLKFDNEGISEVQRKFFGTLYNTYSFFALYANIDGFSFTEKEIPVASRLELDRWILSELNTLILLVDKHYSEYEPTKAGRAIQSFVDEHLSNWYIRLSRRRFWKGEYADDKIAAYQTLYKCLEVISQLASPIAPFFMDKLFNDLNSVSGRFPFKSVHLTDFPVADEKIIDKNLEERMQLAQKISSMVLSLRKKVNIRVRQPLNKIMIPVSDKTIIENIQSVKHIILSEVNIKEIEIVTDQGELWKKKIKPDFKKLGPRFGKDMKAIAAAITNLSGEEINEIEMTGSFELNISGNPVITREDVEIITEDVPGWVINNEGTMTVALDITITEQLKEEGITRELINRIQNIRKDKNYEVTDKIKLQIETHKMIDNALKNNISYICSEILAETFEIVETIPSGDKVNINISDDIYTNLLVEKY